jgi:hypothetical protein
MRDGVRVPVEPFLVCELGHVTRLPPASNRGVPPGPPDDTELIG